MDLWRFVGQPSARHGGQPAAVIIVHFRTGRREFCNVVQTFLSANRRSHTSLIANPHRNQ
jgi:hypothetical protein